jgi:hypothetical protein
MLRGWWSWLRFFVAGRKRAALPWVSDGYLQTLGVPLVAGRYFDPGDTATSPRVAIVNESFARQYFGSVQAALRHQVYRPNRPETEATIVGVVRDVKHSSVRDPAVATCYTPFSQAPRQTHLTSTCAPGSRRMPRRPACVRRSRILTQN